MLQVTFSYFESDMKKLIQIYWEKYALRPLKYVITDPDFGKWIVRKKDWKVERRIM